MTTRPVILVAFAGVLIAGPYSLLAKTSKTAQQQLISLMEGAAVTSLRKLPATKEGINLYFDPGARKSLDAETGLDLRNYDKWLEEKGVGAEPGERLTITKVKIGGKHVEVHFDGGGRGRRGSKHDSKKNPSFKRQGGSRINFRYGRPLTDEDLGPQRFLPFMERMLAVDHIRTRLLEQNLPEETQDAVRRKQVLEGMSVSLVHRMLSEPLKVELPDLKDLDPDAPYIVIEHYQVNGQPLVVWFENGVVKQVRQYGVKPATSPGLVETNSPPEFYDPPL